MAAVPASVGVNPRQENGEKLAPPLEDEHIGEAVGEYADHTPPNMHKLLLRSPAQSSIIDPFCLPWYNRLLQPFKRGESLLMSKRIAVLLVVLMAASVLLSACSTDSRNTAEDYVNSLFKAASEENKVDETTRELKFRDKALELSCDTFKDQTTWIIAWFATEYPFIRQDGLDLKFDVGKAGNQNEIIVTGSLKYGLDPDDPKSRDRDPEELVLSDKLNTRIVLDMRKQSGKWCVSDKSSFGTAVDEGLAQQQPAGN